MLTRRHALTLAGGAILAVGATRRARAAATLNVGVLRLASHAGTFIALERGYFAQAGLDVTIRYFDAAQPMAVAIASGDIDFGLTAITGGLVSLAEKGAVKVIGGGLVEAKGIPGQVIVASDQAFKGGVTDPSKLAGKRFGMTTAGSSFHYMGDKIAQAGKFEMTFVPLQKVGAIVGALRTGQIDAWAIVPTVTKALIAAGEVHQIGLVAETIPDYMVTTVFTSAKIAATEPDRIKAFLSAYSRGVDDHNAALVTRTAGDKARDEVVAIIHKHIAPDRTLAEATPSIIGGAMLLAKNAALNMASIKDQLEWFQSKQFVPASITLGTLVDDRYVAKI